MPNDARDMMGKAEDVMSQISRLRDQVETLMRDKVAPAMGDAASRAQDAAEVMRTRSDALAGAVRSQPLIAIGIAAVVGFFLGRVGR